MPKKPESPTAERTREIAIHLLNVHARNVFTRKRNCREEAIRCAYQSRWIVKAARELDIDPDNKDECFVELSILVDESEADPGEDERLIHEAIRLIDQEYETGKYDGREAVGFFRTLFGRISDELLLKFDESRA